MKAFVGVIGIGLVALAAGAPARAADIPAKAPVYKAEPWGWSGVYVGLNAGYSAGRSQTDVSFLNNTTGLGIAPPAGSVPNASYNLNGGLGGFQVGFIGQTGIWVGALETDFQWTGQRGDASFLCAVVPVTGGPCLPGTTAAPAGVPGATFTAEQKLQWFGTARARFGATVASGVLPYITAGVAYGWVTTAGTLTGTNAAGTVFSADYNDHHFQVGWTYGAGVEVRLAEHWSGRIEYLFLDLGHPGNIVFNRPATIRADYSSHITDNIIRVGLNYTFDWAVTAKY